MIETLIDDFSKSIRSTKVKEIIGDLRSHRPGLVFYQPYRSELQEKINSIDVSDLFHPEKVGDRNCANAFKSGLLIWNDCEHEAHTIAQGIPTAEGSYFHAIIHRREPDIWNSNYWFRKAGDHPVFSLVYDFVYQNVPDDIKSRLLTENRWDPVTFNVLVEEAQKKGPSTDSDLTAIQHAELLFLLAHSYRHSIGS